MNILYQKKKKKKKNWEQKSEFDTEIQTICLELYLKQKLTKNKHKYFTKIK